MTDEKNTVRVGIEMPVELRERCEKERRRRGLTSLTSWIRMVLTDHLDQVEKQRER
jgi:hypothetical protein